MKNSVLLLLFLTLGNILQAQNLNYEWAKAIGGAGTDQGNSIIIDKSGNVYTTGFFMDSADFNPDPKSVTNLYSNGGSDIYISKLDSKGKFVWAINIGGALDDAGHSINLDASGDVYVTGYFQDKADFDPGKSSYPLVSNGGTDIFICKFDASGNFVWAIEMGGKDDDGGNGIDLDASGNVYTTGYFKDSVDFDPSSKATALLVSYGSYDIFVSRLDNKGNYGWAGQMGGKYDDVGYSIALDSIGNIFTAGSFMDQANFDPTPKSSTILTSGGSADIFVSKLTLKGTFVWARSAGSSGYEEARGIVVDSYGNNYTTGYYYNTVDFDPGTGKGQVYNLTSVGNADIFVWKLDASGSFSWAKGIGGYDDDAGLSIALDPSNNVFTTGIFADVVDFDPGSGTSNLTSAGYWDIFISKLNSSGAYDWAASVGDYDDDAGLAIALEKSNSVYTTGAFISQKVDFDPGSGTDYLSNVGDKDIFVLKLSKCKASYTDIKVSACNSYSYNGNTYYNSGNYSRTLKNSVGCDSIVNLKLTINSSTLATLNATACKSYTINGQTYTAEGSYTQTLLNKAGCDSFLVIELKFLNTSGTFAAKGCNKYTINGQTYTATGKYTQTLKNKAGCDSTLTVNLTILKSTTSTITITACNSYKLFGTSYTNSGTYTQIEKNNVGCDSTITLKLTINKSTSETINKGACNSFTLNAQTYTKSGTYFQTLKNKRGCDSLITLNLSINNTVSTVTAEGCQSYILNGQTYTNSGVYNQTIPNAKGCDSNITLNLTVNKVITTVTNIAGILTSDEVGASYQWLDCKKSNSPVLGEIYQSYTPTATGDYSVIVTKNNCSDTSICYRVKVGKIENLSKNRVQVFPNPTNGVINIHLDNSLRNGILKLTSVTGQIIEEKRSLNGNDFILNLTEHSKGVYFIEINQGNTISRIKVIKN